MSYDLRLHGGDILRSETPLSWEEEEVSEKAMMKRVAK